MAKSLAGSKRPLLVTAGVGIATEGRPRTEQDPPNPVSPNWPRVSEGAAAAAQARGVNVMVVRLPQVHDTHKQGLITWAIEIARQKGVAAYVGEGKSRWSAVPVLDCAQLYRTGARKRCQWNALQRSSRRRHFCKRNCRGLSARA